MEDARSPLLEGTAAAHDAAERRSASLPVSELSPPPGELSEDSFICHICLVSAYPQNTWVVTCARTQMH